MCSEFLTLSTRYVGLVIYALASSGALAQEKSLGADFPELVKSFLVPASAIPEPPNWSLGAHPAVRWKSPAPQPADARLVKSGLPMAREGIVQITVDGQVTHQRKGAQPGLWEVTLAGSRASPLEVHLAMEQHADGGLWPADVLKSAGFKVKVLCKPGGISSGTALYAIQTTGYRPVVLAHEWSGGSAGTWMSLTFAYTKQRASKLHCE